MPNLYEDEYHPLDGMPAPVEATPGEEYHPLDNVQPYTEEGIQTSQRIQETKRKMDLIAEQRNRMGNMQAFEHGVQHVVHGAIDTVKQSFMEMGEEIGLVDSKTRAQFTQDIAKKNEAYEELIKDHKMSAKLGEIAPLLLTGTLGAVSKAGRIAASAAQFAGLEAIKPTAPSKTSADKDASIIKSAAIGAAITAGSEYFMQFLTKTPEAVKNKSANFINKITDSAPVEQSTANAQIALKRLYQKSEQLNDAQWEIVAAKATESNTTVSTKPIINKINELMESASKSGGSQSKDLAKILEDNFSKLNLSSPEDVSFGFMQGLKKSLGSVVSAAEKAQVNGTMTGEKAGMIKQLYASTAQAMEQTSNPEISALAKVASDDFKAFVLPLRNKKIQAAMLSQVEMRNLLSTLTVGTNAKVIDNLTAGLKSDSGATLQIMKATLQQLMNKTTSAGQQFDPAAFANAWQKIPETSKKLFDPEKIKAVDGFMRSIYGIQKSISVGRAVGVGGAIAGGGALMWAAGVDPSTMAGLAGGAISLAVLRRMLNNPKALGLLKSASRISEGTSPALAQRLVTAVGKTFNYMATQEIKKLTPDFRFSMFESAVAGDEVNETPVWEPTENYSSNNTPTIGIRG